MLPSTASQSLVVIFAAVRPARRFVDLKCARPAKTRRRERRGSVRTEPERTRGRHAHSRHVRPCPCIPRRCTRSAQHRASLSASSAAAASFIERGYMMRPVAHVRKTPVRKIRAVRAAPPAATCGVGRAMGRQAGATPFISMHAWVLLYASGKGGGSWFQFLTFRLSDLCLAVGG